MAHCYTIEFKKRGLPHAHILIILEQDAKIDPNDIDKVVWAEIPDVDTEPVLHEIVLRCMIHGPCGGDNPHAPCMDNGKCTKKYPKVYKEKTGAHVHGYPIYRRCQGTTAQIRNRSVDNRNIIPHNKQLSFKYNCHINVEICSSIQSVKYLFKYVYKGYDSVNVELGQFEHQHDIVYDEPSRYLDARYVSAPEAMWRLLENKMYDMSHSVIRLPVHLDQQLLVYFNEGN